MSTANPDIAPAPAPHADTDPDTMVVYWPEPSPRRCWWETIMGPAMPADPAAPRSPDPRHPRARDPFLHPRPPTRTGIRP
ncbi:hypothetical protein [Nocardia sp. NPDC046763]|uniref:hypothetical protein n=1 Tax=Nocardia sp. NPDC046763 TaxID=3155256 RepID=UPI0033F4735A